jgi:tetratricopeptide (TPR) repeat protein
VGVRYVLEGSVRKVGNDIRIVAQLIDGTDDSHVWAEKYNGTLDDIFDIQEKVSFSIADALKIKFSQETQQRLTTHSFKDPAVYEIYLQARNENYKFTEAGLNAGEELLIKGIEMAGDNELLFTELCHVNAQYVNNLLKDPGNYGQILSKANQYALKAVQTNPSSGLAYYARGLALYQSCNPREAIENWRKAIQIDPNLPEPMLFLMLGYMYSMTGLDMKEAELLFKKAGEMDPLNLLFKTCKGWGFIFKGKFQKALDDFAAWQRHAEQTHSQFILFWVWLNGLNRNYKEAFRIVDLMARIHPDHIGSDLAQFMKHAWKKEREEAFKYLNREVEQAAWWDDIYALMMAESYSMLEEYDEAFRWLNRAIDYGVTNIPFLREHDHFLENLKERDQFNSSLKKAEALLESFSSPPNHPN